MVAQWIFNLFSSIFVNFLGGDASGWRSAPKRPRLPGRKGNNEKGKGRGQASEKIRSPLYLTWKRVQARGAKVHACGAQIKKEFQEISGKSRECEESPIKKDSLAAAVAFFGIFFEIYKICNFLDRSNQKNADLCTIYAKIWWKFIPGFLQNLLEIH